MPVKEFIFSKIAALQVATLLKNELLHRYFSRILATLQEYLFIFQTGGGNTKTTLFDQSCMVFILT